MEKGRKRGGEGQRWRGKKERQIGRGFIYKTSNVVLLEWIPITTHSSQKPEFFSKAAKK